MLQVIGLRLLRGYRSVFLLGHLVGKFSHEVIGRGADFSVALGDDTCATTHDIALMLRGLVWNRAWNSWHRYLESSILCPLCFIAGTIISFLCLLQGLYLHVRLTLLRQWLLLSCRICRALPLALCVLLLAHFLVLLLRP